MKRKIAMLIMVDGAIVGEEFFEYQSPKDEDWNLNEELTEAQWFFY